MVLKNSSRLERRRNFFRRLRIYGYFSGAVLIIVGAIYLFTGSPLFKIGSLTVVNASGIDEAALISTLKTQVAGGSYGWLGGDNWLAWSKKLEYSTPRISTIAIAKSFWNRSVTITVIPRERYVVWCGTSEICYWVDTSGVIFELAPVADGQLVQTVFDDNESIGAVGDNALAPEAFSVVKKILDGTRTFNMNIAKVSINRNLQELIITTASGSRVIFSLRFDPEPTALPALARFIQKPGLANLEYVNLTVENRAFTKPR
jgi:hypothetical protein